MKKRGEFVLVFSFLILVFSIFQASAMIFHSATNITVVVDGTQRNLNSNFSFFMGTHNYTLGSSINPGHNANQIWVSVQDGETTLFNALNSSSFPYKLCPNPSKPLNYSTTTYCTSNITTNCVPNPSHFATDIQLSSGETLQQAINNGELCGKTPGTQCYPAGINDISCTNAGTIANDGITCSGWSYKPFGTACQDSDHACNGAGACVGWSGTGCGSCPWGSLFVDNSGIYGCFLCTAGFRNAGGTATCNSPLYLGNYYMGYDNSWSSWSSGSGGQNFVRCHCDSGSCGVYLSGRDVQWKIKP